MPIYAYKCESCGFAQDVLQKMADAPLEICPQCAKPSLRKQVTAAGFQLKGSGWYATDFKGGGAASAPATQASDNSGSEGASASAASPAAESKPVAAAPAAATPSTPATP